MKAGKEHRIPLSAPAVEVLERLARIRESEFVFPGTPARRPVGHVDDRWS